MTQKTLLSKVSTTAIVLILALPLLSIPYWFSPTSWGKTIVFRILISILICIVAWRILYLKDNSFLQEIRNRIFQIKLPLSILGILFLTHMLALIFSLDFYLSFWGTPDRSWGILNFSFYIVFALLTFVLLKNQDWKKVWLVALGVGLLATLVAIAQQFGLFRQILVTQEVRPESTFGNAIFFGVFLLLLYFPILSFALAEKNRLSKILYGICLLIFFLGIFLSGSRAALLGLGIGAIYFFLFTPLLQKRIKLLAGAIVLLGLTALILVNLIPTPPQLVYNIPTLNGMWDRLQLEQVIDASRLFGYRMEFQGILAKPLLGYGPYNSYIGFNKFYDSNFQQYTSTGYWDSAHNVFLDTAASVGLIGLAIFLVFFCILFTKLQKAKILGTQAISAHGAQAAFVAYLVANAFSPETFSTFLLLFLLIGYSLHLIASLQPDFAFSRSLLSPNRITTTMWRLRLPIFAISMPVFFWFILASNLRPLILNGETQKAMKYATQSKCQQALEIIDKAASQSSFFSYYAKSRYIDVIGACIPKMPESSTELSKKAVELSQDLANTRPYEVRHWILLGGYINNLIAASKDEAEKGSLSKQAEIAFQKAQELSPQRYEIFAEWTRTYRLRNNPQISKEKADQCVALNETSGVCWWQKALAEITLKEPELAFEALKIAEHNGYHPSESGLLSFAQGYAELLKTAEDKKLYAFLVEIYQRILQLNFNNPLHHAKLAGIYKELDDFGKARSEALEAKKLGSAELAAIIDEFLKTLPK